jgi:ABC-2 type transport system ATP-binding protein
VTQPLLSASGLTAIRGRRTILDRVAFRVLPGEILGVIGPNGAGKTTLFECVAGLQPLTSGTIDGAGARQLFYVPDAIRPWPDQTVRWTLDIAAGVYGVNVDDALLDQLDLARLQTQLVRSLSKGEVKRLNIALGLVTPQPMLFLDEPFDGLDLRQTRAAMELLRATAADGRTLVLSIHQLADAARICDRLLLLHDGRAVAEGTLAEIRAVAGMPDAHIEEVFLALT